MSTTTDGPGGENELGGGSGRGRVTGAVAVRAIAVRAVPKSEHTADELEDACWPRESTGAVAVPVLRLALADGVSDSYLAGAWAREIVRAFGTRAPVSATIDAGEFTEVLQRLCAAWQPRLRRYVRVERENRDLPWWEKRKLSSGSAATVLAVCVHGDGTWTAAALGDTCVFHLRDRRVLRAFPLEDARRFDSAPDTVGSVGVADWAALGRRVRLHRGTWSPGDTFVLASDALAEWALRTGSPWRELDAVVDAETDGPGGPGEPDGRGTFSRWVAGLRTTGAMRDDDVCAVRLTLE
ncbi:protein phosphatase 2C domain-containing protein [Actinomadura sp. WMMB 499]|uniref:protein phosphatase 2C domain-containing protein n=1 Tax=Actinomadura sp. WMMB 499 TaxID=1219491 RepID=UPI00124596B7|nr:protein phosphatase 2C domain-containing protein [Actinomadura sp. WMMB 499]QFG22992.1 protein phosphatase 2C domain-containing protein [Actinomadura sp. WMMB 499]